MRRLHWLLLLSLGVVVKAHPQITYVTPDAPLLGSAWYPEQWMPAQYPGAWERDLALMEAAHFTVVRVGEFAWSSLEPSEGKYDFAWLDRAVALAAKHHLKVVIGTPTDAPPAWLTARYPETLGTDENGRVREHGGRRQFNYASAKYRELCARIVAELARCFGHNEAVIGWQIGNEYTDESFDAVTRKRFQDFLRERYKTLDSLNQHWTTSYWSQTYTDWSQIPFESTNGNPGLLLEHKHFVTATWRDFQQVQIDVLRKEIDPGQFITTNIGGLAWSDNWDHYAITAPLNLASWDEYVGTGHLDSPKEAMLNDFVRGWKQENFWLMETQPGTVNWSPLNNALYPGETRALAWQAVGHGADAVLYWQWRSALNGQEQYHGAIVGPDGEPNPLYPEVQQLGAEFQAVHLALQGTTPHADVALLYDYDSRWAIDFQPFTREYDQQAVLLRFYTPLAADGRTVDIVDPMRAENLNGYKLLVAPSLNVISEALAAKLLGYVEQGGHLLLGPRSGMKDEYNALTPQRQPGPLTRALGAKVEQFYALEKPVTLTGRGTFAGADGNGAIWAETLRASDPSTTTDLLYGAGNGWLAGHPAMVTRAVGKGSIGLLGTLPDEGLMKEVIAGEVKASGATSTSLSLPVGVELCTRSDATHSVLIVINHNTTPQDVTLNGRYKSLLAGTFLRVAGVDGQRSTVFALPGQGVAVLTLERVP